MLAHCSLRPPPLTLATTVFPSGHTAWPLIFYWIPGARALRALSRVGRILLVPAAIGVALLFQSARTARRRVVAGLAALVFLFEQGQSVEAYNEAAARANRIRVEAMIGPSCGAVLFAPLNGGRLTWDHQVDGGWAGLDRRVPTINGYSGNAPPDWDFQPIRINDSTRANAVQHALDLWERQWGTALRHVCVVSPNLAHVHEPLDHLYDTDVIE
ncbi:MAG TPA: hypothetical protein VJO52_12790 [Gemmatimonadaceae bacterium]|nr:hypothetical protein [Gemmatimonadaceae bacterium]